MKNVREASSEELTKELQKGVEESKSKEGFKFFKSPTEMYSALDSLDKKLDSISTYCKEKSQETYSRISSFSDLVKQIKLIVSDQVSEFPLEQQNRINDWLLSYDENPTSDGFSEALRTLRSALTEGDWINSIPYERLHNRISQALSDYEKSSGEVFYFSSLEGTKKVENPSTLVDKELESRDSAIWYLCRVGFNKESENSYFKDIHGNRIDVELGSDDVKITVSGNSTFEATVPFDKVSVTIQKFISSTEAYSGNFKKGAGTSSEVQSYSRSYTYTQRVSKSPDTGYVDLLKRMAKR